MCLLAMLAGTTFLIIGVVDRFLPSLRRLPPPVYTAGLFLFSQLTLTYMFYFQVNMFKQRRAVLVDWTAGLLYGTAGATLLIYALKGVGDSAVAERTGVWLAWASFAILVTLFAVLVIRKRRRKLELSE